MKIKNIIKALILSALFIIYINRSNYLHHFIVNNNTISVTKKMNRRIIRKNQTKNGNFSSSNITDLSTFNLIRQNKYKQNVVGIMSIPKLEMKNLIYNGYGENGYNMLNGVSTMKPNQSMGERNYALAGHYMRLNSIFHNLHLAKYGYKVYLTDLKNVYIYKIIYNVQIMANNVEVIDDKKDLKVLTMITCVSSYQSNQRTFVQAKYLYKISASQHNLKKFLLKD